MAVMLPVPAGTLVPFGPGLVWMETGVGAKPARFIASVAAPSSATQCATWSRKISPPIGSWRSASISGPHAQRRSHLPQGRDDRERGDAASLGIFAGYVLDAHVESCGIGLHDDAVHVACD